jgi:hypothetical protein
LKNPLLKNLKKNVMKKKIEKHFATEEFYKDSDGYWVVLKTGYTYFGCEVVHELTLKRIWFALTSIEKK